jgi:hypothetical protein
VIVGIGVASMHYLGMAAMSMPGDMHYNAALFILSVVIAIVAGTAALWAGTRVRGVPATIGASLIMGVAVSGMHYTGMAAMTVSAGSMPSMSGSTGSSFLVPLLLGVSLVTFVLTLTISLSPTEDEIHADAVLQRRLDTEFSSDMRVNGQAVGASRAAAQRPAATPRPAAPSAFTPSAFTRDGYNTAGRLPDVDDGQPASPQPTAPQAPSQAPPQPLPSRRAANGSRPWGQPRAGR